MKFKTVLFAPIFLVFSSCSVVFNKTSDDDFVLFADSSANVFNDIGITDNSNKKIITKKVERFYKKLGYHTWWLKEDEPGALYSSFQEVIANAENYGLNPENYNLQQLQEDVTHIYSQDKPEKEKICETDRYITAMFLLYVTHLNEGRIMNDSKWFKDHHKENEEEALLQVKDGDDLKELVDTLHPNFFQYDRLLKKLKELNRQKGKDFKKLSVTDFNGFKIGAKNQHVKDLRVALNRWGIDAEIVRDSLEVDSNLVKAIRFFQIKRGMDNNGMLDAETIHWLNLSREQEHDLVELNLERLRWLPKKMGEHIILINIPEYQLKIYEKGEETLSMKVIVGSEYNSTPLFGDTLKYIVFSPTWTVPLSIINEELIPKLIADKNHFDNSDFKIYENDSLIEPKKIKWKKVDTSNHRFRFVQQPGPANALGLVKFIMPNSHSIYLHDTPDDRPFNKDERALSHGCIRLNSPKELAIYLLKNQKGWDRKKIEESMHLTEPKHVNLTTPYYVQLAYLTAWVGDDGILEMRKDIYNHDKIQLKMLNKTKKPI